MRAHALLILLLPVPSFAPLPPTCNATLLSPSTNNDGADFSSFPSPNPAACLSRCCSDPRCLAFTFTSWQPHPSPNCPQSSPCCWLKSSIGASSAKPNCTSGAPSPPAFLSPRLTRLSTVAEDPTGHLRDPSSALLDAATGTWHFWVDYIPLAQGTQNGWHAYLHHYTAPSIFGPWASKGLALNWSSDASAWDSGGTLSPSVLFSAEEGLWFLFYTGTNSRNYSATLTSAQLVATAPSPDGPWTKRGLACWPTGGAPAWGPEWNARRCDSGRALVVGGRRGYWTKGVKGDSFAQEGAYFPLNSSSFLPPFAEWGGNPIFNATASPGTATDGYENCEFFRGPDEEPGGPWLHVLCQSHGGGQPHFVTKDNLRWHYVNAIDTTPALEPTPVYSTSTPGDEALVAYFIARAEPPGGKGNLRIDLFSLQWE